MAVISGILIAPDGTTLPNVSITLKATITSESVVITSESTTITDSTGSYHITAEVGSYFVILASRSSPTGQIGTIQILPDSPDGTLNDFLLRPTVPTTGYTPFPGFKEVATFSAIPSGATGFYLVDADETKGGATTLYAITATAQQWIASVQDS